MGISTIPPETSIGMDMVEDTHSRLLDHAFIRCGLIVVGEEGGGGLLGWLAGWLDAHCLARAAKEPVSTD